MLYFKAKTFETTGLSESMLYSDYLSANPTNLTYWYQYRPSKPSVWYHLCLWSPNVLAYAPLQQSTTERQPLMTSCMCLQTVINSTKE